MPIEIQELHISAAVSPREALNRIIKTASRGPGGMNAAVRGVKKMATSEEGVELLKEITLKFTLFNGSGTPLRASLSNSYPVKWTGPQQNADESRMFNLHEFKLSKSTSWTEAKATKFVLACVGKKG